MWLINCHNEVNFYFDDYFMDRRYSQSMLGAVYLHSSALLWDKNQLTEELSGQGYSGISGGQGTNSHVFPVEPTYNNYCKDMF